MFAENYFREHELLTIAVLCDIILPNEHPNGGALDAGLPDFVEFMVKDRDQYKLPVRGGVAWLDSYAIEKFGSDFINISEDQRLSICEEIAYPDTENSVLQITDLLGKSIKTIAVNKGENKIQIKNLPPNSYFVRINEKICEKIGVR